MLGARNRTTSSVVLSDPSTSGNRETKALGLNQAVPCWSTGSLQVGPGTGHWRYESNKCSFDNHLKAMCKKRMLFASSTLSVCKEERGRQIERSSFLLILQGCTKLINHTSLTLKNLPKTPSLTARKRAVLSVMFLSV